MRFSKKELYIGAVCSIVIFLNSLFLYIIFNDIIFAILDLILAIGVLIFAIIHFYNKERILYSFFEQIIKQSTTSDSEIYKNISMPVLIIEQDGNIIWYNHIFRSQVLKNEDRFGYDSSDFFTDSMLKHFEASGKSEIKIESKWFTVYRTVFQPKNSEKQLFILYFADNTTLKLAYDELTNAKPVVGIIAIDVYDDLLNKLPSSEMASIQSSIEKEIENWTETTSSFSKRLSNRTYLIVTDEKSFSKLKSEKFRILDNVRKITTSSKTSVTLSIGIGRGENTLKETEEKARQALDMALSRGGDQVAVIQGNTFEFFGGVTNSTSNNTAKVKTRVVAAAIKELISGSDYVFVTGHRFSDLDCIGSAIGIHKATSYLNIPCHIVIDKEKSLATPLIEKAEAENPGIFISQSKALSMLTKRSLLVVVDTHKPDFLDAFELYSKCPTVVVIDHHRKNVNHIENAVIFHLSPTASSTSEMVAELIQYMGKINVDKFTAEALLAGITLDSRNFVLRTGVRTFEASAYLRNCGADPVEVRKLFSDSIDVYKEKSEFVASAQIYKGCAISYTAQSTSNTRIAAAQAADELLGIRKISASFVVYKSGGVFNISARSMGEVNVQLIMEELGGGGHHTMAAAQLKVSSLTDALKMLTKAIDSIKNDNDQKG